MPDLRTSTSGLQATPLWNMIPFAQVILLENPTTLAHFIADIPMPESKGEHWEIQQQQLATGSYSTAAHASSGLSICFESYIYRVTVTVINAPDPSP